MSIASEITRLQGAKASLKSAIEAQGITVPASTLIDGYAALIADISAGDKITIKSNYTDPVSMFEGIVPSLTANTIYILIPTSLSSPTQNNQLYSLIIVTDSNGNRINVGNEGVRYRSNTFGSFNYSSAYAIAVTIGDEYLLMRYEVGV